MIFGEIKCTNKLNGISYEELHQIRIVFPTYKQTSCNHLYYNSIEKFIIKKRAVQMISNYVVQNTKSV